MSCGGNAQCTVVATGVVSYRSALVDLRYSRAVHSIEHYPCLPNPYRVGAVDQCGAVHYGLCVPVQLVEVVEGEQKEEKRMTATVTEARHRFENGGGGNAPMARWRSECVPRTNDTSVYRGGKKTLQEQVKVPAPTLAPVPSPVPASVPVATQVTVASQPPSQNTVQTAVQATVLPDGGARSLPHPKLTCVQKQHLRWRTSSAACLPTTMAVFGNAGTGSSGSALGLVSSAAAPTRPFLTKGSVAERVLIFERCPNVDRDRTTATTTTPSRAAKCSVPRSEGLRDKENYDPASAHNVIRVTNNVSPKKTTRTSTLDRTTVPRFYFPNGQPVSNEERDACLRRVSAVFSRCEGRKADAGKFGDIAKACRLPLYCKMPLFLAAGGTSGDGGSGVTEEAFLRFWKRLTSECHDDAAKFVRILSCSGDHLVPDDFVCMMQDVVDTHPGLSFLKEAAEFHSRYVHTVIARIFYCVNRSWSGRICAPELRRSNFLQVVALLEEEEDINRVTEYFSYEHFYVIYCKFWELDKDHDLLISKSDLAAHNDHAVSSRMIDRIFSGAVTRGAARKEDRMTYTEFVWFLMSEEDKRHPTSIEYWFRCMDLDGDGFLSMFELEYFYEEQLQRMDALGIEALPFQDCLCQMLDMVQPKVAGRISLRDLKRCRMTPIFFDTFFNLEKYLDHEQRDPFASQRDHDEETELSDWDRYAAEEYELLVAEEGNNDPRDDMAYDDDYEPEDEEELCNSMERLVLADRLIDRHEDASMDDDYAESDDYQY